MTATTITHEHRGLARVHSVCAEMDAIWRPTSTTDLGIDGQIEFLEPGTAVSTGRLLAVQVKSGPSYFESSDGQNIKYTPAPKHRRYWQRLVLPVVLILHNPEDDLTVYCRVKPQLQSRTDALLISLDAVFAPSARQQLLGAACEDLRLAPPGEVLASFRDVRYHVSGGTQVTGIHFLLAAVDPTLSYLEVRMTRVMTLFELAAEEGGISIGSDTYDFILRCVLKIWSYQLLTAT